ncbi:MAG: transcriptional repressor [Candidatus Pacebacteria bacterium]|nr:transcriptional repressor [Candidatus Paceibacterota bacterium]MBP9867036.1 transcriptional repressor [Candidatus Paceibacterota bacterium]
MKSKDTLISEAILKDNGYRVTSGRIALLTFLRNIKKPVTVKDVQEELTYSIDKVTLYRALEDFTQSKIVIKINLQSPVTYYEFLYKDHHHHHIICEKCGKIEDITTCNQHSLQKEMLTKSHNFKSITSHSLEFFGICKTCTQ